LNACQLYTATPTTGKNAFTTNVIITKFQSERSFSISPLNSCSPIQCSLQRNKIAGAVKFVITGFYMYILLYSINELTTCTIIYSSNMSNLRETMVKHTGKNVIYLKLLFKRHSIHLPTICCQ